MDCEAGWEAGPGVPGVASAAQPVCVARETVALAIIVQATRWGFKNIRDSFLKKATL